MAQFKQGRGGNGALEPLVVMMISTNTKKNECYNVPNREKQASPKKKKLKTFFFFNMFSQIKKMKKPPQDISPL